MSQFTFHASVDGNDSNTGASWDTPLATLQAAIRFVNAAGGGHVKLAVGVCAIPSSVPGMPNSGQIFLNASNMVIEGIPGGTIIRAMNVADGGFQIGFDSFTRKGGIYSDIHLIGLTIDMRKAR